MQCPHLERVKRSETTGKRSHCACPLSTHVGCLSIPGISRILIIHVCNSCISYLWHISSAHKASYLSNSLSLDRCPFQLLGGMSLNLPAVFLTPEPLLPLSVYIFFNLCQLPLLAQWLSLSSLRMRHFSRLMWGRNITVTTMQFQN